MKLLMPDQKTLGEMSKWFRGLDKKSKIVISTSTVIFFLFVFFVVIPAWITRPVLQRAIQKMESKIRQVNELNQKKIIWGEDQVIFNDAIQKAKSSLFKAEEIGLLLGKISRLANEASVDVLSSKPSQETVAYPAPYNSQYEPHNYEFTLSGSYHQVGHLVSLIESYERLLRIQNIKIQPSEESAEKQTVAMKVAAISVPTIKPPIEKTKKKEKAKSEKKKSEKTKK